MSDIGLYAELHVVLFITFGKGLYHILVLTTLLQPVRRWILSFNLILNIKQKKRGRTTGNFGGVIKQRKTIAHKMWKRVSHLELCAECFPGFSIKAVKEISYIFFIGKIAFSFKENRVLCKRYRLNFFRVSGAGVDHHD